MLEPTGAFPLPRKAREKMLDSPHAVGNGFTCPEKRSSAKLPSVLEAVAGEYALVINGHSLVSVLQGALLSAWLVHPASFSVR